MYRVISSACLVLVFIGGFAGAQDDEGSPKREAEAALREFDKYIGNPNENVRKAAVEGLFETNHLDLVKPILKTLQSDDSEMVRLACIKALGRQSCKTAVHELTRILKTSNKLEERLAILEAFKTSKPAVAYETLLTLATSRTFELRFTATQLLGILPAEDDRAGAALIAATLDGEPQIRLAAIESLIALKHPEASAKCIELMQNDTDWRVRATAISGLRNYRVESSIQPLIDTMRKEDGRLKDDCHEILKNLTGFTYSGDPDVWQRWWDRVKGSYKIPTLAELRKKKQQEDDALAEYKRPPDRGYTPYHGIKTRSKRMLFIIDISNSMRDKVILAGADKAQAQQFQERYKGFETKVELAREEMIETVASLGEHVKFNIVTFHSEPKSWKPGLVPANSGTKNEAIKFLSKLTPQMIDDITTSSNKTGKTNTFDVLALAFGLAKQPNEKPTKDHTVEADTVFLLTDGMPSEGRITDPEELLRFFRVVNARAKIVFHTITFGHGNESLLRPLAEDSGGKYVEIGY